MIATQPSSKVGSTVWLPCTLHDNGSRRHRSPPPKTVSSTHLQVITAFTILACSLIQHRQHQHRLSSLELIHHKPASSTNSKNVQESNLFRVWSVYLLISPAPPSPPLPALPLSRSMTNLYLLCAHRQAILVGMRKRNTTLPLTILASGRRTSNY